MSSLFNTRNYLMSTIKENDKIKSVWGIQYTTKYPNSDVYTANSDYCDNEIEKTLSDAKVLSKNNCGVYYGDSHGSHCEWIAKTDENFCTIESDSCSISIAYHTKKYNMPTELYFVMPNIATNIMLTRDLRSVINTLNVGFESLDDLTKYVKFVCENRYNCSVKIIDTSDEYLACRLQISANDTTSDVTVNNIKPLTMLIFDVVKCTKFIKPKPVKRFGYSEYDSEE